MTNTSLERIYFGFVSEDELSFDNSFFSIHRLKTDSNALISPCISSYNIEFLIKLPSCVHVYRFNVLFSINILKNIVFIHFLGPFF
jgi:hypothetical protein